MIKFLLTIKKYWLKFAALLAYINTRIILSIVYIIIFPFFAIPNIISRIFKKKEKTTWKKFDREINFKEQF